MITLSGGINGYVVGDKHRAALPGWWRGDATRRGILHCPGLNGTADSLFSSTFFALPQFLAEAGLPIMSCDYGGNNLWGNSTSNSRMDSAWSYMQSAYGVKNDKVILIGGSHGTSTALRWMLANPTKVACCVLNIPAVNFIDLHDNDRGPGAKATLEAAYGTGTVSSFVGNATISGVDPYQNMSAYAALNIPIKGFYSTNDPLALPQYWLDFAATVGIPSQSLGAVGHSGNAMQPSDAYSFLKDYL